MSSPWKRVRAPKVLRRDSEMSMQEGKDQGPADFSAFSITLAVLAAWLSWGQRDEVYA